MNDEIKDVYKEDTSGRKWHTPIMSKNDNLNNEVKEGEKHHGDVVEINFNKPIARAEFNKLSDDTKKSYLRRLQKKFCVTSRDIGIMFGVNHSTISKELKRLGISRKKQTRKSPEQAIAWKKFLEGFVTTEPEPQTENVESANQTSVVETASFTQAGIFNASELISRISALASEGDEYTIYVSITKHRDKEN